VETLTDETNCAFDEIWKAQEQVSKQKRQFFRAEGAGLTFSWGASPRSLRWPWWPGAGDENGGVLNFFYVRLKKVNKRGKIASSWHRVEKLRPPHKLTAFGLARAENATTHQLERHNLGSYRLD